MRHTLKISVFCDLTFKSHVCRWRYWQHHLTAFWDTIGWCWSLNYQSWNYLWLMGHSTFFLSVFFCFELLKLFLIDGPFHSVFFCFEQLNLCLIDETVPHSFSLFWTILKRFQKGRPPIFVIVPTKAVASATKRESQQFGQLKILRSWDLEILRPRSVEITIGTWVPIPKTLTWCKLGDTPFWATSHLTRMIWDCQKLQKIQLPSQRLAN